MHGGALFHCRHRKLDRLVSILPPAGGTQPVQLFPNVVPAKLTNLGDAMRVRCARPPVCAAKRHTWYPHTHGLKFRSISSSFSMHSGQSSSSSSSGSIAVSLLSRTMRARQPKMWYGIGSVTSCSGAGVLIGMRRLTRKEPRKAGKRAAQCQHERSSGSTGQTPCAEQAAASTQSRPIPRGPRACDHTKPGNGFRVCHQADRRAPVAVERASARAQHA